MKRISKDKAIEIILQEIEKGSVYSDTLAVIVSKCKLNEKTFAVYWKEAQDIHQKRQEAINERVITNKAVIATENRIRELLSKERKREILQSIIEGEEKTKIIKVSKGVKIEFEVAPSLFERMKAIEIDNAMNGDNAPTNQNIKITGNPLDNLIADNKVEVIDSHPDQPKEFKKLK